MPRLEVTALSEAPAIPTRQSLYAIELINSGGALEPDQVLRVTPDDGKNLRGMRAGIGRSFKAANMKARTSDDGIHACIANG